MVGLAANVEAPDIIPTPYGLLSIAAPVVDSDDRWIGGFNYESEVCNASIYTFDVCNISVQPIVVKQGKAYQPLGYKPVVIQAADDKNTSTLGFNGADRRARVIRQLQACTEMALERELWTGGFSQALGHSNRYLAHSNAVDVTPTAGAAKLKYAVGLLEEAMGNCSCSAVGTIHMPRAAASLYGGKPGNSSGFGEALYTNLGTPIVAGTGYPGTGPNGSAPAAGQTWLYASGGISVRLTDPVLSAPDNVSVFIDTRTNTFVPKAERFGAVTWDGCCHFAIRVDLAAS